METQAMVDLGFTATRFPAGTHICQIFSDEDERNDALLRFLASGLRAGECSACFSDSITQGEIEAFLRDQGLSLADACSRGAFALSSTTDVYFQGGDFDPARMLGLLREFHAQSVAGGFPNARVIGEMTSDIERVPGGSRLLEYESRVSLLLREHPITAVCQYDARAFRGATIMDVLKVHPMMVVRGTVVRNPYFVSPEEYLS